MAGRTDFVILNKKLEQYYKFLLDIVGIDGELSLDDNEKRKLGFYLYILENLCGIDEDDQGVDYEKIIDSIIDTDFNKKIFKLGINDRGMDAVFIDEDSLSVKLFNFKFRSKFNPNKSQELNDCIVSTKFLNLCLGEEDVSKLPEKMKTKVEMLRYIFTEAKEDWNVTLYQVSNEAKESQEIDFDLKTLSEIYAIKIETIALPTISQYMSIRPEDINASIIVDKDALMCYSEDSKATAKSYIIRVPCSDIIRLTCDNESLRLDRNLENIDELSDVSLDFRVLFDNVRGFVKSSKYNPNIVTTLKEEPTKFFMYNNGLTIVAKSIDARNLAGNNRMKLDIKGIQVVNGGQTLRSIHNFNEENNEHISRYLCNAEVLLRVFEPDPESNDIHRIAEYTNSQNSIKSSDLKSLSSEQINIERFLDEHNIGYIRKSGDTGLDDDKNYEFLIKMEKFGQILTSVNGHPEKSTNSIKAIFEKDYKKLFITEFNIENAPNLILKYYDIIKEYKSKTHSGIQIKYFYVLYLIEKGIDKSISDIIEELEGCITSFEVEDLRPSKMMTLSKFKDYVDSEFKIN